MPKDDIIQELYLNKYYSTPPLPSLPPPSTQPLKRQGGIRKNKTLKKKNKNKNKIDI
jgi:hypothetical protein